MAQAISERPRTRGTSVDQGADRRGSKRVDAKIQLELQLPRHPSEGRQASAETINVSSAGLYFRSSSYIEPMTKLAMSFDVPMRDGQLKCVSCEGVVARIVPEIPAHQHVDYEVAVSFTHIDKASRRNLTAYVEQGLLQD